MKKLHLYNCSVILSKNCSNLIQCVMPSILDFFDLFFFMPRKTDFSIFMHASSVLFLFHAVPFFKFSRNNLSMLRHLTNKQTSLFHHTIHIITSSFGLIIKSITEGPKACFQRHPPGGCLRSRRPTRRQSSTVVTSFSTTCPPT